MKYIYLIVLIVFSGFVQAGIRPADGLWNTADDPVVGSGLMLITQDGTTIASVFTYDQNGSAVWYLASGEVDDEGVFEAVLYQTHNGSYILDENPQSAEFFEQSRTLRLEFNGTQVGSLSIDGSEPKIIRPIYFGVPVSYGFPELTGQWLVGSAASSESFILDLAIPEASTDNDSYVSTHPSTDGWVMKCYVFTIGFNQPYCGLSIDSQSAEDVSYVEVRNIGSQRMELNSLSGDDVYQAFRLNKDQRLLPNDGYWRSYDDPAIGSGLVMHTQGDYTAVVLYTYNDQGQPIWQVANGQFDENGVMTAQLNYTNGGSAIESPEPVSAVVNETIRVLQINLLGMELATFSIDGSVPKSIQNFNFGVELFGTEQVEVMNEPYLFPNQADHWALVSNDLNISDVVELNNYSPNSFISPTVPWYNDAKGYRNFIGSQTENGVFIDFICTRVTTGFGNTDILIPFCEGYFALNSVFDTNTKTYFEDIGYRKFRQYYGVEGDFNVNNVNRNSDYLQLFRLDN